MNQKVVVRQTLLRWLYAAPRFRGRDRLIDMIAATFVAQPTRLPDGLTMQLDASEWAQLEILVKGATEPLTLKLIGNLVMDGDLVFDVGAHVGHHALVAARGVGETGRVFAIDPQPYNVDRIALNADLNNLKNIVAICAAAGKSDQFVRMPLQNQRDRSRLSFALDGPNNRCVEIEVALRRLDTFMALNNIAGARLVKIDVEGYELEVLLGLGSQLKECQNIILEILDEAATEKVTETIQLLVNTGFSLKDIMGRPWKIGQFLPEHNLWASRP
jgi:FkbM family methyltransferase